ncbi:MAG: AbrB/MazE/SpoVT family DNA-binding domain-containing protein [Ignisphaera sp.]|uniref:AbrB/MazE/SpoVT family DNA-binding domain-containing protein n=1 Tax=Ignisphaera aggregans TaxID=334771 RepID=A0A7J3MY54_9CREN
MEVIVRIDAKGCIMIPSDIRKKLGIDNIVRLRVEEDKIIVERIKDPIEFLELSVVSGTNDVEMEIGMLRKAIDEEIEGGI